MSQRSSQSSRPLQQAGVHWRPTPPSCTQTTRFWSSVRENTMASGRAGKGKGGWWRERGKKNEYAHLCAILCAHKERPAAAGPAGKRTFDTLPAPQHLGASGSALLLPWSQHLKHLKHLKHPSPFSRYLLLPSPLPRGPQYCCCGCCCCGVCPPDRSC